MNDDIQKLGTLVTVHSASNNTVQYESITIKRYLLIFR